MRKDIRQAELARLIKEFVPVLPPGARTDPTPSRALWDASFSHVDRDGTRSDRMLTVLVGEAGIVRMRGLVGEARTQAVSRAASLVRARLSQMNLAPHEATPENPFVIDLRDCLAGRE